MLTGLAILERELGIVDYERHRLKRLLAGKPPKAEASDLRARLKELDRRRATTLRLLDDAHEDYEGRIERAVEGIRARASRSPPTRRESREEARRRLGLPR
jgi:hypothetical protein